LFRLPSDVEAHLRRGGRLVVPSAQRSHAVRLAHAARELASGHSVWTSADVLPAETWLRAEAQRRASGAPEAPRLLSSCEEWYLWREATREATSGLVLLDTGALAESLRAASALAADYGMRIGDGPPGSEAALLHQVQRRFIGRCAELSAANVRTLLEKSPAAQPPEVPALMAGFDTLTPRLAPLGIPRPTAPAACEPLIVQATDTREELERIAAWCGTRVRASSDARLLVMLPGTDGARERLAALIRQEIDPRQLFAREREADALVGIEGGEQLAHRPMIRQALITLQALAGQQLEGTVVSRWLRAPYWDAPSDIMRAAIDLALRARPSLRLRLRDFTDALSDLPERYREAAAGMAARLREAQASLGEGSVSPRTWSERAREALARSGWPGAAARDSDGAQTLLRWHELLEEFGDLGACVATLNRERALGLLEDLAGSRAFRPADADVTVMLSPRLADSVVHYDGIWVAGLHADEFPQPVAPDPFLPLPAQLAAGLAAASSAGRRAQAQGLIAAWRSGTAELVLSAPLHQEDQELLPSPLLAGDSSAQMPGPQGWLPARLHRPQLTETLLDYKGTRFDARQALPRGVRSLELQNSCPFRAYVELRLGAREEEEAEPGVTRFERGDLLHLALQRLWKHLKDSRTLKDISDSARATLITQCVQDAAREMAGRGRGRRRHIPHAQLDLFAAPGRPLARELRRAARLIEQLCQLERKRPEFRVRDIEVDAQLNLAGARVDMRIDRVDELPGGGRVVLDYKSGRITRTDWYGDRPSHPQLLAYLAALGPDVEALAVVSVIAKGPRFHGLAHAARLLPQVKAVQPADGWAVRHEAWRATLERLIGNFLAGDAAVDPKPNACKYCHVSGICRIAERAVPAQSPDDESEYADE
jgi:ATP-dependent helicase/nuclease subunit B